MNTVKVCDGKEGAKPFPMADRGTMWTLECASVVFMVTDRAAGHYVSLDTGMHVHNRYDFANSNDYHEVFCVTIERARS